MTIPTFQSPAEAEQYAASLGIRLSPADRDNIAKSQKAELNRLLSLAHSEQGNWLSRWILAFNRFYPRCLEFLTGLGDVLLTFTQTVIISLGIPVLLVLLLIVEQQRVVHGIMLFEADASLASFAAWALVMLNLVLEFQIHYVERRAGYRMTKESRFSLRLWFENAVYIFGLGKGWQVQNDSPAKRYKSLLRLVTFSVLALALGGSMRVVISKTEGAWYEALVSILVDSNLLLMVTWIGGLLFAGVAVLSAQGLSRYIALRTVEILENMASAQGEQQDQFNPELDVVATQYILAKVAAAQARQNEKNASEVAFPAIPLSTNGVHRLSTE